MLAVPHRMTFCHVGRLRMQQIAAFASATRPNARKAWECNRASEARVKKNVGTNHHRWKFKPEPRLDTFRYVQRQLTKFYKTELQN